MAQSHFDENNWVLGEDLSCKIFELLKPTKCGNYYDHETVFDDYKTLSMVSKEFYSYVKIVLNDYAKNTKIVIGFENVKSLYELPQYIFENKVNVHINPEMKLIETRYIINKLCMNFSIIDELMCEDFQNYERILEPFTKKHETFYDNGLNDPDTPYELENEYHRKLRNFTIQLLLELLQSKNKEIKLEEPEIKLEEPEIKLEEPEIKLEEPEIKLEEPEIKFNEKYIMDHILSRVIMNDDEDIKNFKDHFASMIFYTGSLISGSSILQILLNETFENSDIDIYCKPDKFENVLFFFIKNSGKIIKMESSEEPKKSSQSTIIESDQDSYLYQTLPISTVTTILCNGVTFQIITVFPNDHDNHDINILEVTNFFDLSFCKCSYLTMCIFYENKRIYKSSKGLSFYNDYPENIDLIDIINKTGTYDLSTIFKINRMVKYIKRGFKIKSTLF